MKKLRIVLPLVILAAAGVYAYSSMRSKTLTLTGIVTTNDVIVSPQVAGQIGQLLVSEGDVVKKGQLLATLTPDDQARAALLGVPVRQIWREKDLEAWR